MKKIGFYVTDLGLGHMTRSLAIIENIMFDTDSTVYLVSGESQLEYARVYLARFANRVTYQVAHTEAGTKLKDNSFEIDIDKTVAGIKEYLGGLEETVAKEVKLAKELNLSMIVTDVSIVGIHVAKALNIKCVAISNYTFYHRYKKLGIDQELIQPFIDAYNSLDMFFEYDLADDMSDLTCPKESVGLVARSVNNQASTDLKSNNWPSCFVSIGQTAKRNSIEIDFMAGYIYLTGNLNIEGNAAVIKLPHRIGRSQDYISASSLAIIKPGWAQVAECMIVGIPFGIIDANPIEDGELTGKLLEKNACFKLQDHELDYIDVKKLNMLAATKDTVKAENAANDIALKLVAMA